MTCFLVLSTWVVCARAEDHTHTGDRPLFRVCADPNNLPYSDRRRTGFENKIAGLLARELDRELTYTWWPQRRGFIRSTLNAQRCDVVMGIPSLIDTVLTTRPYYRSTYVFVSRPDDGYRLASLDEPRLRTLRIGVHLIGDDYHNSPPAHLLAQRGIVENVVGYSVFGDYSQESPPGKIVAAVADGDIDTAIVWGPIAGYFSRRYDPPLTVTLIPSVAQATALPLHYDISMGVRHGDTERRAELDEALARNAPKIRRILAGYGVPLIDEPLARAEAGQARDTAGEPTSQIGDNGAESVERNPYTGNTQAIVEGFELYKMLNCYGCHGLRGGGGMGPNITDEDWKEGDGSDARLFTQLMEGRAKMPAFGDVIDRDMAWKLIAYVRTLYKGDPKTVRW